MNSPCRTLALTALMALAALPPLGAQPPPRERPAPRERAQNMVDRLLQHVEATDPDEHARLTALRESDPPAFREEMRSQLQRLRNEMPERRGPRHPRERLAAEIEAVQQAPTEAERDAALAQLHQAVASLVDQRFQQREQRIQQIQTELERLQAQHQSDLERRAEWIQDTVDALLTEPDPAEAPE